MQNAEQAIPDTKLTSDSGIQSEFEEYSILTDSALRKIIPSGPAILDKRIQPTLDFYSLEFLSKACLVILGTRSNAIPMMALHYRQHISIENESCLTIKGLPNNFENIGNTHTFASLFIIVPGIGHSLRINGQLENSRQQFRFHINEVYFHCARAAARSELFDHSATSNLDTEITEQTIIERSPYLLLKTTNKHGKTEISPRGDEVGFVKLINTNTVFIPERPGNKIAVSLRNIIQCSDVEILFIVPHSPYTLNVRGTATITKEPILLQLSDINGKKAKVGIRIEILEKTFQLDKNIEACDLWNSEKFENKQSLTPFSKALSSHINGTGLLGKATHLIVDAVVKHDMNNLY